MVLGFLAAWLVIVVAGNLIDAFSELGALPPKTRFASGNFHQIVEQMAKFGLPAWIYGVLYAGAIALEAAATVILIRTAFRRSARSEDLAFALLIVLFGGFVLLDELSGALQSRPFIVTSLSLPASSISSCSRPLIEACRLGCPSQRTDVLSCGYACAMHGIEGLLVRVETDAAPGTPELKVIGLPDRSLSESTSRVRAAVHSSGFMLPAGKLLVNLAPADVRKEGPGFDLPIALALLAADRQIPQDANATFVSIGELALDGVIRAVPGVLPTALAAKRGGCASWCRRRIATKRSGRRTRGLRGRGTP